MADIQSMQEQTPDIYLKQNPADEYQFSLIDAQTGVPIAVVTVDRTYPTMPRTRTRLAMALMRGMLDDDMLMDEIDQAYGVSGQQ